MIAAAPLPMALDAGLFQHHFERLLASVRQDAGGIEAYLAALNAKSHRIDSALAPNAPPGLAEIEGLLAGVFTARRRLYPTLEALGAQRVGTLVHELVYGNAVMARRLQNFVDAMPGTAGMSRAEIKAAAKLRRAAWDFAAELLHFRDPRRFPLMTRWVWDAGTQSGALRELIRGSDTLREIPFDNSPELFEGARRWLAERIAERGIYRDEPLWIDLLLAQAYTTYFRSMAEGGLGADFGRGVTPQEQLKKLLGIDAAPAGRTRVKKAAMSTG
ncbi:MAG: hypothetical protein OEZ08_06915 [Betaproteobacteria bacterium]|nr:hypothetical protein [Betaproteobacteria bacterium]